MSILKYLPLALLLWACENQTDDQNTDPSNDDSISSVPLSDTLHHHGELIEEKNGIALLYFPPSPEFPDAGLALTAPKDGADLTADKVNFSYAVKNFQLGAQTSTPTSEHCANSAQGQHIHHILNNEPYTAHYTDTFSKVLKPSHYVNLSFLSRSYHESIKSRSAYSLTQFNVGGSKGNADLKAPHLFYSRPKGEYLGKDTGLILLDFYIVNTALSESGNRVRATVNGTTFMLTEWRSYGLQGLPMGENTIKLELLDASGNAIPGPYNTVERKITLGK